MTNDEIKQMTAMTALNNMMQRGYFDICAIRNIAEMLGIDPRGPALTILQPLHCIDFAKMPPELRAEIPGLIKQCLGVEPIYQFRLPRREPVTVVEPEQPKQRGLMRLLSRST